MNTQTTSQASKEVTLTSEPSTVHEGEHRAVIKRGARVVYVSAGSFPTTGAAQRYAAQVFLGIMPGYSR